MSNAYIKYYFMPEKYFLAAAIKAATGFEKA